MNPSDVKFLLDANSIKTLAKWSGESQRKRMAYGVDVGIASNHITVMPPT